MAHADCKLGTKMSATTCGGLLVLIGAGIGGCASLSSEAQCVAGLDRLERRVHSVGDQIRPWERERILSNLKLAESYKGESAYAECNHVVDRTFETAGRILEPARVGPRIR